MSRGAVQERRRPQLARVMTGLVTIALASCSGGDESVGLDTLGYRGEDVGTCSIPTGFIFSGGVGRDGIPALSDPDLVHADDAAAAYLQPADRVIGIEVDGEYIAIPHNILWYHEIVNFNDVSPRLSVTYCPLTGSSIVFDRSSVEGVEFGVSGLLYNNNLIMYDRSADGVTSLWPQMAGEATCGPRTGHVLEPYPSADIQWGRWVELHPDTRVVSGSTGFSRDYELYPYGAYEALYRGTIYPNAPIDASRPPKERVLGIRYADGGGIAFPFRDLHADEPEAISETIDGEPIVVFWSGATKSAVAFWRTIDAQALTFEVHGGGYVDVETGSEWSLEGVGLSGPMQGRRLTPVAEAFVSFWFAWATFVEGTEIWAR